LDSQEIDNLEVGMSSKFPVAISFSAITNLLGTLAVLVSLVFIAYELRMSNKLAEMEALNRAYEGSAMIRGEFLTYADIWIKALNEEILSEVEEEQVRLLCGGRVSNLNNNWAQDILGNVKNKIQLRLNSAEALGAGPCSYSRESFATRGELYVPLLEAFDRGRQRKEK
jgi:hypothetical protein